MILEDMLGAIQICFLFNCSMYRRWKVLFPDEVPMLQEAKKIRREAFISNFVDREEERPALRPNDIVPTHKLSYRAGCETASANKKRKLRYAFNNFLLHVL